MNRRKFLAILGTAGITQALATAKVVKAAPHYFPYYEKLGYQKGLCPKAEKLYEEIISLPLYYAMTDQDVEDVIRAVTRIAKYFDVENTDEA